MRMKKIMILAVAAIALAACSRTFDTHPSEGTPIGFGTWTEHMTKATSNTITNAFANGDNFAVYGYKDKTSPAPATVFDDVVVSTTDGSTWTYTTPRFWDSNFDSYTFFAISPATVGTEADGTNGSTNVNAQTGAFVTRTITFAGNDNDILVADKKTVEKGSVPYFNNYATVPIVFNHVAALVDFKVKKAHSLANATVTLSAFQLSDIDNQGQLTVTAAYTDSHPVASWTDPGTARTTYDPTVDISTPITIADDTAFVPEDFPTTPAASTDVITNLVVMPQTFRASGGTNPQKITLTYKIAVTGSADVEYANKVIYLNQFDIEDDDYNSTATNYAGWEPGKHYTFYITLDAHKIDFSATITGWTPVSGYNYLLN